jgi:hypothetical protein
MFITFVQTLFCVHVAIECMLARRHRLSSRREHAARKTTFLEE